MSVNACIITNQPQQKRKLTQLLQKHPLLSPSFPRTIKQIVAIAQQSTLLCVIISLPRQRQLTHKICETLKKHPATQSIPLILVQDPQLKEEEQIADAYLPKDFSAKDFDQIMRQLTMGY